MQTNLKENLNFFERILQIIKHYDIGSVNNFAKNYLGYAASEKINRLRKEGNNPSYEIILDISNKFEDIDLNWLITGKGYMLKSECYKKNWNLEEESINYERMNDLQNKIDLDDEKMTLLDNYIEEKIKSVLRNIKLKID